MIWQQTPYTIPLIVASALSIVLGLCMLSYYRTSRGRAGALIILADSEWMLTYALELAGSDLPIKVFWSKMQFCGIVIVPTGWLVYVLYYTGRNRWLTRRTKAFLSILPVLTLVLVFTNEAHGLIWTNYILDIEGPFSVLHNTYGLWLWVYIGYAYILMLIGAFLLIQMLIHSHSLYRWQTSALLFGASLPWAASALIAFGVSPSPYVELTPLVFPVSNLTVAFSLVYLRLEDIIPLARETIIEHISDSIIVLDRENRIVDVNPSAQQLVGNPSKFIGESIEHVWPEWLHQMEFAGEASTGKEILLDHGDRKRLYDVEISPLTDWRGDTVGRIIVLRDITDRRRSEKIKASLEEKEVLLREIHHRVKNNMQIISSLLNLQSYYIKDKKYVDMLKESQDRIKSMALIHEKLYQSESLANIKSSDYIAALVNSLFQSYEVTTQRIAVKLEIEDMSLDIDTAIPCGLIINELVSNSLKHAFPDREGEIMIVFRSIDDTKELTVSDNGVGIPEDVDFKTTESLGLHLVTILAEDQLDGEITLDRSKGTTFCITFNS